MRCDVVQCVDVVGWHCRFALHVIPPLVEGRHGVFRENPSAFRAQLWDWMGTFDVLHPILLVSSMPGRAVVTILVRHRDCMLVSQGQKNDKVYLGNPHQLPINCRWVARPFVGTGTCCGIGEESSGFLCAVSLKIGVRVNPTQNPTPFDFSPVFFFT